MVKGNILVTIIVPVYNLELYIGNCIQSILMQTYSNLQVIIVDDGSTDNSKSVIEEYAKKDSRINALYQTNAGVSSARNNGLRNAKGQFIMFVDGDDEIERIAVERLLDLACSYNVDVVSGNFIYVDKKKNIVRNVGNTAIFALWYRKDILKNYLLGNSLYASSCARLYARNFLERNNILFSPELAINEDGFFTLQVMSKLPSIVVTGECLYRINVNSSSTTRNSPVEMREDITPKLYEDFLKSNNLWESFSELYKSWYIKSGASKLLHLAIKVPFSIYMKFWEEYMKKSNFHIYNNLRTRFSLGLRCHFIALLVKSPFCSYYFMRIIKALSKKNSLF